MSPQQPALGPRPDDDRLYSRVTRRSVAILKHISPQQSFTLTDMAKEIRDQGFPEFFVARDNIPTLISSERIRDYLNYLGQLDVLVNEDRKYHLNTARITRRLNTDAKWVERLSLVAREHLSTILPVESPTEVPDFIQDFLNNRHGAKQIPTVASFVDAVETNNARGEEILRWSLYMYTDGAGCEFDIRQFPHLTRP
jgi:hypothetical protein